MDINQEILNELKQIRRLLTIFSQDKLDEFYGSIKTKYLTTSQREQMYELFDGTNSMKEIAAIVRVSPQAVGQFVMALEQVGLVEQVLINGRQKNPKRVF